MKRILLLGGYGGYGRRIAIELAAMGHDVLVAGRSFDKAQQFCAGNTRLTPVSFDRKHVADAIAKHGPDLVVDASGPFQSMDYTVPKACIAASVSYCDIADGRDFVCGIAELDADARRAGVAIISGASSVPALSGAVVRHLADGLERIIVVDMAISASNHASVGPAVASAILDQVGQPFRLWRGGRWMRVYGWQEIERQDFEYSGTKPVRGRWIALADVPDLALLPTRLPGNPAVGFRAGTELGIQNLGLWAGSWLVRWGICKSLSGAGRFFLPLQRMMRGFGSDRSAMLVRLFGMKNGRAIERRWTLIADKGDGPDIPALSVPLIVERIFDGTERAGACDAGLSLQLADYALAFSRRAIRHEIEEFNLPPPLYQRVMGEAFERLSPSVRTLHLVWRDSYAKGRATVSGPGNILGRMIGRIIGFPKAGDYDLHVGFVERDGVERWTRDFGGQRFSSELSHQGRYLQERFGPLRFRFDLQAEEGALEMVLKAWSVFRFPLPLFLAPRTLAREWEEDGVFRLDVSINVPLIGRIARYEGWLWTRPEG